MCIVWCKCRICRVHCDVIWAMFVYMFMFVLRVARGWCQYHWVDDARPHIRRPEPTYRPRPTRVCMRVYIRTGVTLTTTRYSRLHCYQQFSRSALCWFYWLLVLYVYRVKMYVHSLNYRTLSPRKIHSYCLLTLLINNIYVSKLLPTNNDLVTYRTKDDAINHVVHINLTLLLFDEESCKHLHCQQINCAELVVSLQFCGLCEHFHRTNIARDDTRRTCLAKYLYFEG